MRPITLLAWTAVVVLGACGRDTVGGTDVPSGRQSDSKLLAGLVVSEPVVAPPASPEVVFSPRVNADDVPAGVAYISLLPGTVSDGTTATLTHLRTGYSTVVEMDGGGFDPQPIPALVGDTIEVRVTRTTGSSLSAFVVVAPDTPPIIVRTVPPSGETDVPINTSLRVVFSEPLAPASVTSQTLALKAGGAIVPGASRMVYDTPFMVEFIPDAALEGSKSYVLSVANPVQDLSGHSFASTGSVAFVTAPAAPVPLVTFASVTGANSHVCALTTDSRAYCWGDNRQGQLGDGTFTERHSPVPVAGGLTFRSLSADALRTCGVTFAGIAYCWGNNSHGALGDGSFASSAIPVRVATVVTFVSIAAGSASCALTAAGEAYCWGMHDHGGIGVGSTSHCPAAGCPTPQKVGGNLLLADVSVGAYTACGRTSAGAGYCWGFSAFGEVGFGSMNGPDFCTVPGWETLHPNGVPCARTPAAVAGGLTFTSVVSGGYTSCGLVASGAAFCWGANNVGQFGNGARTGFEAHPTPESAAPGFFFRQLAVGNQRMCGIALSGSTYCWATNIRSQVGCPTASCGNPVTTPNLVPGGFEFTQITIPSSFACGLTTTKKVYCWGGNVYGGLGNNSLTDSMVPVLVAGQQ